MKKLKFDNYTVEYKTIETASNYDLSVHIYRDKEMIGGTILKRHTKEIDILKYAIDSINSKWEIEI